MRHPSMTTRGMYIALVLAVLIALALPMRVKCGSPGATCGVRGPGGRPCWSYQVEPLAFFLLEHLARRDVGFAYSSRTECQ